MFSLIDSFSKFPEQRPYVSKCEVAGIGVLKNENVALYGMKNIDLIKKNHKHFRCTYFLQQKNPG